MKPEVAAAVLNELRDIRYSVYKDAESFDEGVAKLEHIGQLLLGKVDIGFGKYQDEFFKLSTRAPAISSARIKELAYTVKETRNESVHSGAFIRHRVSSLVDFVLILEEAIAMNSRNASDLMVRNPVTAESWHNIAMIRRAMLAHSFSYIPFFDGAGWKLIADLAVIKFLDSEPNSKRDDLLGKSLTDATKDKKLTLLDAPTGSDQATISDLKEKITHLPILIVDQDQHLLEILSAFDLL
jgi:hypothetical protein